ncbi:MAG: hypothetical protein AB1521_00060 [Bacteroidota bacterium]
MTINTNSFGNYSTSYVNKSAPKVQPEVTPKEKVTQEEKTFFARMYPAKQEEIMKYEFYNPKGKITGVSLGSVIDKRG